MGKVLPKGTQILCPRKRHLIGVTSENYTDSDTLRFSIINFEPGQSRIAGEPMKCKLCDSAYFVQNKLHTRSGWMPTDPFLEPVSR